MGRPKRADRNIRATRDRHRGSGHPLSPATPSYMRVRVRRFSSVELKKRPAVAADRARRSKRQGKRMAGPDCSPVAKVHGDYRRSVPQGQFRRSVGAVEQIAPSLASIASRSRIAACAGSILPALAAPKVSDSSRSIPSSLVSSWPAPSSSALDSFPWFVASVPALVVYSGAKPSAQCAVWLSLRE